jgi:hypothetical protein
MEEDTPDNEGEENDCPNNSGQIHPVSNQSTRNADAHWSGANKNNTQLHVGKWLVPKNRPKGTYYKAQ